MMTPDQIRSTFSSHFVAASYRDQQGLQRTGVMELPGEGPRLDEAKAEAQREIYWQKRNGAQAMERRIDVRRNGERAPDLITQMGRDTLNRAARAFDFTVGRPLAALDRAAPDLLSPGFAKAVRADAHAREKFAKDNAADRRTIDAYAKLGDDVEVSYLNAMELAEPALKRGDEVYEFYATGYDPDLNTHKGTCVEKREIGGFRMAAGLGSMAVGAGKPFQALADTFRGAIAKDAMSYTVGGADVGFDDVKPVSPDATSFSALPRATTDRASAERGAVLLADKLTREQNERAAKRGEPAPAALTFG